MTHPTPSHTEHWQALPNPELAKLPMEVTTDIVRRRAEDLFEGGFETDPRALFGPVEVTRSQEGVKRMRARIPDTDMRPDGAYYAGIILAGDIVYAERNFPARDIKEIYQINTANPAESVAFRNISGKHEAQALDEALISMIHLLGTFSRSYIHGQGRLFYDESYRFSLPDLCGPNMTDASGTAA